MTFTSKYSTEQWDEARRLHLEGLTFAAIAKRLGFGSPDTIRARSRKEGWGSASAEGAAKPRTARPLAPSAARIRQALALRLFGFISFELRTLELSMKRKRKAYEQSPGAEPPEVTDKERASFAALIQQINQVTEMASEPAPAADGRRKSASLDPELTALSDELDAAALAAASEKDSLRREIADELEKLVPPSAST